LRALQTKIDKGSQHEFFVAALLARVSKKQFPEWSGRGLGSVLDCLGKISHVVIHLEQPTHENLLRQVVREKLVCNIYPGEFLSPHISDGAELKPYRVNRFFRLRGRVVRGKQEIGREQVQHHGANVGCSYAAPGRDFSNRVEA